jgi:hypothetical protein
MGPGLVRWRAVNAVDESSPGDRSRGLGLAIVDEDSK